MPGDARNTTSLETIRLGSMRGRPAGTTTDRLIADKLRERVSVKDFGALGDGATNDRAAIQAAIDYLFNNGGGELFFPAGVYQVEGLTDTGTGGYNSILRIPQDRLPDPETVIALVGECPAPGPGWFVINQAPPTAASVIRTSTTGSGSYPALLAAAPFGQTGSGLDGGYSNTRLSIENLIFRCQPNPTLSAIQCNKGGNLSIRGVRIDVNCDQDDIPFPTTVTAVGLYAPNVANPGQVDVDLLTVQGYRVGVAAGEHFVGGSINIYNCYIGLFAWCQNLPAYIKRLLVVWCPYSVSIDNNTAGAFSGLCRLDIAQLVLERRRGAGIVLPNWGDALTDIHDPGTRLVGTVAVHVQEAETGAYVHPLLDAAPKYYSLLDLKNAKYLQPITWTGWHNQATILTGNALTTYDEALQPFRSLFFQSTAAQNDAFAYYIQLAPGVYTLSVLGAPTTDAGIVTWYLDDISQGTQDWYAPVYTPNTYKTITLTAKTGGLGDGVHVLRGVMATKHASSSGYKFLATQLTIRRNV
jgi:hypothetical protein